MAVYVARRSLAAVPTLLAVLTAVFLVVRIVPGDPAQPILGEYATAERLAALRAHPGLDRPVHVQYAAFLGAVRGDLGRTIQTRQPVSPRIADAFPRTLELAIAAAAVASPLGVPLGILSAVRGNTPLDYATSAADLLGISMPSFWTGMLLILLFSVHLGWLPITGAARSDSLGETLRYLFLPALALGAAKAGLVIRLSRSAMLEAIGQDCIRTAPAKGLAERVVIYRHALRNALIPMVTIIALDLGCLPGRTVIVESLFVRPGLGQVLLAAMPARDYPRIQGAIAFAALMIVAVNTPVDIVCAQVDLRVRYG